MNGLRLISPQDQFRFRCQRHQMRSKMDYSRTCLMHVVRQVGSNLTAVAVLPDSRPVRLVRYNRQQSCGEAKDYGHRVVTASPERESTIGLSGKTPDSRGGSQTPQQQKGKQND